MNMFSSSPSPSTPSYVSAPRTLESVLSSSSSSANASANASANSNASSSNSGSIFSSWIFWLVFILLLAYAGFNIFNYLAKGTQTVANTIGPVVKFIVGLANKTASQTVYSAAEGTKGIAQEVVSAATQVEEKTKPTTLPPSQNKNLNTVLQQAPTQQQHQRSEYSADDATSSTQQTKKTGWCFIGEVNGVRNCVQVNENDTCQSGIVTQEKC